MTKVLFILTLLASACAYRPYAVPSTVRVRAMEMFVAGATTYEIADALALDHRRARELIRESLENLSAKYYGGR